MRTTRIDTRSAVWAAAAAALMLVCWWYATDAFRADRAEVRRKAVTAQAEDYARQLESVVQSRASQVEALRSFVEREESSAGLTETEFRTFAEGQMLGGTNVRTIQIAPSGVIKWTYPLEGNRQAIGLDLLNHPNNEIRRDAQRTLDSGRTTLSGPYPLAQGGTGFVIRTPVVVNARTWGLAALVLDVPSILRGTGIASPPADLAVVLRDSHDRVVSSVGTITVPDPVVTSSRFAGEEWQLTVAPRGGWTDSARAILLAVQALGLLVVGLVSVLVYLILSRQRRLLRAVELSTAELRENEARYRVLFEESPVSLWEEDFSEVRARIAELRDQGIDDLRTFLGAHPDELRDLVGRIRVIDINRATLELYGAADRESLLRGLGGYVSELNDREFVEQVMSVADGRTEFRLISRLPRPGGDRVVGVAWVVVPGHEDDYGRVVVSVVDLTERARVEAELEAYKLDLERIVDERTAELTGVNEQLTEAQRAKDAFLASMSHELRTPLNSILGFTGIMLQGASGPLNDEQRKQLEMVRRSGRQLLALVDDVLDLAKIEAGHAAIERTWIDMPSFLNALVEVMSPLAAERGLRLTVTLSDDAPADLRGDRERLRQILLNLLSNAVKFTERGEVELMLADDGNGSAVFRVRDTGPGIPVEQQDAVFERFHQLPRDAGTEAKGTGLGLAISRDLATLLGGSLVIARSDGDGSVFELRIPIDPDAAATDTCG